MQTKLSLLLAGAALVAGTAFVTSTVVRAQQDPAQEGQPPMDPEMMAKMMELATPGEEHAELAKTVGTWSQHYKFRWAPDQPWMETDGTAVAKPLLGGRYIMEEVKFEMMGMPMEGIYILGYDKMKGEYISLWMDSMSTWWVTARGKADANGVVTTKGTMVDIAGERPFRMVIKPKGDNAIESEMYDTIDGKEVMVMQISSKKK